MPLAPALAMLELVATLVQTVEIEAYSRFESVARERIVGATKMIDRFLAAALALDCPVWTEDTDFFGCGVATWTTDRVELYLSQGPSQPPQRHYLLFLFFVQDIAHGDGG